MSVRNRPRGVISRDDLTDESHLWSSVQDSLKKLQLAETKYNEAKTKLDQAEQAIPDDDPIAASAALDVVSNLHRECLKLSEDQEKILNQAPDDLIKNLELLTSIQKANEEETPAPRERHYPTSAAAVSNGHNTKSSRNSKRKVEAMASEKEDSTAPTSASSGVFVAVPTSSAQPSTAQAGPPAKKASRSGSVSAKAIAKAEPTSDSETVKGATAASTASTPNSTVGASQPPQQSGSKFVVGGEVFYRIRSKDKNDEGEGIICTVTTILGDGKHRKYEVQDTEPDENGDVAPPIKATAGSLIAIPTSNAGLPPIPKGRPVFARYPGTNTFYRAEVVGRSSSGKKDTCRLRFDGEEAPGTEKEVERRYVLDVK